MSTLIAFLGLRVPGTVTKLVQHLKDSGQEPEEVVVVSLNNHDLGTYFNDFLRPELRRMEVNKERLIYMPFAEEKVLSDQAIQGVIGELVELINKCEGNDLLIGLPYEESALSFGLAVALERTGVKAKLYGFYHLDPLNEFRVEVRQLASHQRTEHILGSCDLRSVVRDYRDGYLTEDNLERVVLPQVAIYEMEGV